MLSLQSALPKAARINTKYGIHVQHTCVCVCVCVCVRAHAHASKSSRRCIILSAVQQQHYTAAHQNLFLLPSFLPLSTLSLPHPSAPSPYKNRWKPVTMEEGGYPPCSLSLSLRLSLSLAVSLWGRFMCLAWRKWWGGRKWRGGGLKW